MKRISIILSFGLFIVAMSADAQTAFEQYKNAQQDAIKQFKEDRDKEFAEYLRKSWEEFSVESGLVPPVKMKPTKPTVAPKDTVPLMVNPDLPPVVIPEPVVKKVPEVELPIISPTSLVLDYYQVLLPFEIKKATLPELKNIDTESIADYWESMAQTEFTPYLIQLKNYKAKLQLNDWSYYLLVKQFSKQIYTKETNQTAWIFFILNQSGLNTKLAQLSDNTLCLLLPVKQQVYQMSFVNIDNQKYYVVTDKQFDKLRTFEQDFNSKSVSIDLIFSTLPFTGVVTETQFRTIQFNYQSNTVTVKVPYQPSLIRLYNDLPLADLKVFFNAPLSPEATHALQEQFVPYLKDKNEQQVADFLLSFVQHGFAYEKDGEQFGREKFFFSDELFAYPYCDCEDRSVLFSYLIKVFLNRKTVGLKYSDHVATAVLFETEVGGSTIKYNNQYYTVCDPTYIGASIGMAMPKYQNVKAEIIAID